MTVWSGNGVVKKTELSLHGQDTYNGVVKSASGKNHGAVIAGESDTGPTREGQRTMLIVSGVLYTSCRK
jgi:hypothetical protein